MLSVKNLVKIYQQKKADPVRALDGVSIDFADTGLVFLLGKSGSGKSTLLNAIGGLDSFNEGEIIIKGKSSKDFSQSDFDSYRNTFIGFIFQEYNILENFTVEKNLALAIELQGKKPDKQEIHQLLEKVDMLQYAKRKPNQLSGGQKQRVAIARALIKHPEIIMADEPTGALDSNTGKQVMETLKKLSKEKLVIIVSHDREFAEIYGDRIIELKDGKIISDVTKKEVVSEATSERMKVIGDNILYIKKGQQLTQEEMKKIILMVNSQSKNNDTFISFDDKANAELKKGAAINDDGNREKFEKTEAEDIKLKKYNPKSLKLIKSKLKFSDSFKMGASSLKNKVGKLIFTILLSFIAFTIFGLVDALSCWNRGDSVYQAMQMTNQTSIVMKKYVNQGTYSSSETTSPKELEELQKQFPNHTIKGVVGDYETFYNVANGSISYSSNELWSTNTNGYIHLNETELEKLNFKHYGSLPSADDEICISKHMFDTFVKLTAERSTNKITEDMLNTISSSNPINIELDSFTKIVGVIDDKTNLDKYKNMSTEELSDDDTLYYVMRYSYARLVYVSESVYNNLFNTTSSKDYYPYLGESESWIGYSMRLQDFSSVSEFYEKHKSGYANKDLFIQDAFLNLKTGIDPFNLAKDEIIVPKDYLSACADIQTDIDNGLIISLKTNDEPAVAKFKVVGTLSNNFGDKIFINSDTFNNEIKPLYLGYDFLVSALIGNDVEDKKLIDVCENYDKNGIKFTIQNSATMILDMMSDILEIMTSVFVWVAVGFAVFASLLLMNFISTSISQKKREIGVLRALGARGSDIFGIFFNESTIIAMINFVLSAIATIVVCNVLNTIIITNLGFEVALLNAGIRQVILIFAVSLLASTLATLIPSIKISRKKPIDAINNR